MSRLPTKFIVRLSIGIILVILLLLFVSPSAVIQSLRSANPFFLIGAIVVYALAFIILTARWRLIVAHMGGNIPFGEAYQAFAGGVLYSDFTPGRIGDFSRAILVQERIGIHKGTVSVFVDRYIDIIVLTGLGIIALVIYSSRFASILPILALIVLLVVFAGVTALFLQNSWVFSLMKKIPFLNIPEFASHLQDALLELRDGKKVIAEGTVLTVLAWVTHALRIILITMSLGYTLPLPDIFLILPLISALSIIPVTIAGLGLVEGGLMAVIAGYGVPLSAALSIAILDRGLTMLFHFVVGGRCAVKNILR
nr:lysylphosphatidylglycerol synthase transmembrane domain-containing protein [uncultured Methanoregula sp.]